MLGRCYVDGRTVRSFPPSTVEPMHGSAWKLLRLVRFSVAGPNHRSFDQAAGAAPLYLGQPGYGTSLDRDRDGVTCEK